jgi:hypothetical protein
VRVDGLQFRSGLFAGFPLQPSNLQCVYLIEESGQIQKRRVPTDGAQHLVNGAKNADTPDTGCHGNHDERLGGVGTEVRALFAARGSMPT